MRWGLAEAFFALASFPGFLPEKLVRLGIFQKFSQAPPGTGFLPPETGAPKPA
jgi:hypothetical protein